MSEAEVFPGRPRVVVPCGCTLGEGPVWDDRTATLFWVDVKAPALWRWQPAGPEDASCLAMPEPVGFAMLTDDPGRLIVGLKSGIAKLDLADGRVEPVLDPEPDRPGNRLNDACIGPDGDLHFGTMDDAEKQPTGQFYRWSPAGLQAYGEQTVVTNGPTLDLRGGLLYATDTTRGRIYRHPLGPEGHVGAREDFVTFEEGWGHPDGSVLDAEGHLWVCHFGGSRITRFAPDGRAVLILPVPTAQVCKAAFGGPNLSTLYITTAAIGRDRQIDPMAGHLFAVDLDIAGLPAARCTVPAP